MMLMMNDTKLLAGLRNQEEPSVSQFLESYWDRAYRMAYQLSGDPAAAEDIAQETFVQVLRAIHGLREPRAFRTWFFWVLERTAKKHHRSRARRTAPRDAGGTRPAADRPIRRAA